MIYIVDLKSGSPILVAGDALPLLLIRQAVFARHDMFELQLTPFETLCPHWYVRGTAHCIICTVIDMIQS